LVVDLFVLGVFAHLPVRIIVWGVGVFTRTHKIDMSKVWLTVTSKSKINVTL